MAIFTDKVVSATFMDYPQNTIVDVIYKEGDQNIAYTLEVDFTQEDFKALLQEVTLEEIEKATKHVIEAESAFFEKVINDEINQRWTKEKENQIVKDIVENKSLTASEVLSVLFEKNEDKDFLFNMKIAILDDNEISKSKDKTLKTNIRKSRSVLEILSYISDIMKK